MWDLLPSQSNSLAPNVALARPRIEFRRAWASLTHAVLSLLSAFCIAGIAFAQDSATIKADPSDLFRPVSTLISQLRQREGIAISYEDPRYSKRDDMEGPNVAFTYSADGLRVPDGAEITVARMLREYGASGGLTFTVIAEGSRLYVVPNEVLDSTGKRVRQTSVLDTMISVSPAQRNGAQLLQAICDQIQKQTGYEIGIGPSAPINNLQRYSTTGGIDNLTARAAIAQLLDRASPPRTFAWDLYFDPADGGYGLNFAYVGRAGPVSR